MSSDSAGAEPLIEVDGLEKVFSVRRKAGRLRRVRQEVRAVDGISFQVPRGEMVGYIGPNGAGKSTTIKMLTGILVPSGGRLRIAGIDPSPGSRLRSRAPGDARTGGAALRRGHPDRERTRLARRIGVVFGQRTTLWWDLPLKDSYELVRRMYRVPDAVYRANLERCVELLDLGPLLAVPVRQLSLGQRMRGDLAAALLHDPEVLYLDEPTIGLDVVSKAKVREFLREVNAERGTTVLLTTHDLTDIEQLCRRVMVIDHGRLVYDGGLDGLRAAGAGERTLVVDLERQLPPIEGVPGARTVKVDGPRQWLAFPASQSAAPLVAAVAARYPLVDLSVREPDIEAVIAELYASSRKRPDTGQCGGNASRAL
ncbi:ATP-binding cassette domain-containing protein [Streptomyces caniferus]|uniref:ABC transporter ATP-binding protein n=1 Tax=Streptomyces caniferus TaxID=285557 RepID=UPI002E2B22BE|nr:ATP-binding cassette domain-containing protein [Streptomyces caniferus]